MKNEVHPKKLTVVRVAWLAAFGFAAACFGLSWLYMHRLYSALYTVGFLAIALRGFVQPIGSQRQSLDQPSKTGGAHRGAVLLGFLGPVLVIAGAWLK